MTLDLTTPATCAATLRALGVKLAQQYAPLCDPAWDDGSEAAQWVRLALALQRLGERDYEPRT